MMWLQDIFGTPKPIIGNVHFLPLPGSALYDRDGGIKRILAAALADATALQDGGIDAILFCNEGDRPYRTEARQETIAAYTFLAAEVARTLSIPYGVNFLLDAPTAVAIAHAIGGCFVRGYFTGAFAGDMGLMITRGAEAAELRGQLGSHGKIKFICNITAGFGASLGERSVEDAARGAVFIALADALCVSGPAAGIVADMDDLRRVRAATPEVPVFVGTGATPTNIAALLEVADGAIVGTSLKVNGETLAPVDPQRVRIFMQAVRAARGG